jgi:hypothetical protein
MIDYVKGMVDDFPKHIHESLYLWNDNLFKVDYKSTKLSKEKMQNISYICGKRIISLTKHG